MNIKDAYYFSHDSNARQDEKILALRMKHGWEGYGLFWALVEKLRESTDYILQKDYNIIAFDLRVSSGKVKSIVEEFGLFAFTDDGKCFYSERLFQNMEKKSSNAKKAANARWGNKNPDNIENEIADNQYSNAEVMQVHSNSKTDAMQNDAIKVKESKGNKKEKKGEEKKAFIPPALEDVKIYFREKGYTEDSAIRAWEYYESNDWKDRNQNQVLNWKQKVIAVWFKDENKLEIDHNSHQANKGNTYPYKPSIKAKASVYDAKNKQIGYGKNFWLPISQQEAKDLDSGKLKLSDWDTI